MILISHRGNIDGKLSEYENNPNYILAAINLGYDVEIDVWFIDGKFMLGHDEPTHEVDYKFLMNEKLWCHAKNLDSLIEMKRLKNLENMLFLIKSYFEKNLLFYLKS